MCFVQEENEELGREAAEGRVAGLERQLALARGALGDMRRAYLELEDAAAQLDDEAEELQLQARHNAPIDCELQATLRGKIAFLSRSENAEFCFVVLCSTTLNT